MASPRPRRPLPQNRFGSATHPSSSPACSPDIPCPDSTFTSRFPALTCGKTSITVSPTSVKAFKHVSQVSYEAKLRELLRNLCTIEIKIYSDASKEFAGLLKGDSGGDLLCQYIQSSPKCSELIDAWKLRQGKPGMMYLFLLISAVLDNPVGKSRNKGLSRSLDDFARLIVGEKLEDVYIELKSEESKRQNAALRLMTSVVQRGSGLASEVANTFDFKLPLLSKRSGIRKIKGGKDSRKQYRQHSTRKSFVEFAMSFLEVGNPRFLKWILQQRDMYYGVLRDLGSDDEDTIVLVLSTLRDKVLTVDSLLPTAQKSVLFGSVTLEQLSYVSGNPAGGPAPDLAHEVLLMVCTDPCNGLMPSPNLKGNHMRLWDFMKKLKASEVKHHKDLLLAIVKGRPSLCSSYMDVFPYNLEPCLSSSWFSAISLAADLISSANSNSAYSSLTRPDPFDPPTLDSYEVQCILKCIIPRSFVRPVSNKGLLHSDTLVKHGSLKLLLESLKSLHDLLNAIDGITEDFSQRQPGGYWVRAAADASSLPGFDCLSTVGNSLLSEQYDSFHDDHSVIQKWASLKKDIQDEVRTLLPDPQVLLKLLLISWESIKRSRTSSKRCMSEPKCESKRLKSVTMSEEENIDIVISGIGSDPSNNNPEEIKKLESTEEVDLEENHTITTVAEIWDSCKTGSDGIEEKDAEILFYTKLLDTFAFYLRTVPTAMEGLFDFFKLLPSDPSTMSFSHKKSLVSLLVDYMAQNSMNMASSKVTNTIYRHLQPLLNMLIYSHDASQLQAYELARSAMLSTGAFDKNPMEVDAWLLFLPGFNKAELSVETQGDKMHRTMAVVVVPFLCDCISTIGNQLYTHLDQLRLLVSKLDILEDSLPHFSPLVVCILQKCLRVLESNSGSFNLSDKITISLYVSNSITFLMQTQVQFAMLSGLVNLLLDEKLNEPLSIDGHTKNSLAEWRPLKNLLHFAQCILHQKTCDRLFYISEKTIEGDSSSLARVLNKAKQFIEREPDSGLDGLAVSLSSAILSATPTDILGSFPLLISLAQNIFGAQSQCLSLVIFLEWDFLAAVANLWPKLFFSGFKIVANLYSAHHNCASTPTPNCNDLGMVTTTLPSFTSYAALAESSISAFSLFLRHALFHAIFPSCLKLVSCNLVSSTDMLDFLKGKLSEGSMVDFVLSAHLILFWAYQIRLSYKTGPSDTYIRLFELCIALVEHIVGHIHLVRVDPSYLKTIKTPHKSSYVWEVADLILHHPIIHLSMANPLYCSVINAEDEDILCDTVADFLSLSRRKVNPLDLCLMQLLGKVTDSLITLGDCQNFTPDISCVVPESLIKTLKSIIQKSLNSIRLNFIICIEKKDLASFLPIFYVFHSLMHLISPFELVELVDWMLSKTDVRLVGWKSPRFSPLSVILYIAEGAFSKFFKIMHQKNLNKFFLSIWDINGREYTNSSLERVYFKILDFSTAFDLEFADQCVLKLVDTVYKLKILCPATALLPLNMLMLRMVISSPMKILTHCICNINRTKSMLLYELVETSPLHSRFFGMVFSGILRNKFCATSFGITSPHCEEFILEESRTFSNKEFILMIPAALSYLNNSLHNSKKYFHEISKLVSSFYSNVLINGFSNWREFVCEELFYEEYDEALATPPQLQCIFNSTLIRKSIFMLHHSFCFERDITKRRQQLNIFECIYGSDEMLLDFDVVGLRARTCKELFNAINRTLAKTSFAWLLLFPPEYLCEVPGELGGDSAEMPFKESSREKCAKLRFMDILVAAWDKIAKETTCEEGFSANSCGVDCLNLFLYLEEFLLKSILELVAKIRTSLDKTKPVPFLMSFIKSSLLYRFENPNTLKAIHHILLILKEQFIVSDVLELLLGHSKFASVILSTGSFSDTCMGAFLQPIPSIFKLTNPFSAHTISNDVSSGLINRKCSMDETKLELIKLLSFLFHMAAQNHNNPESKVDIKRKELLCLLLSGYGATLSESDLAMFHLLDMIECIEGSNSASMADVDYLWGSSALNIWKQQMSSTVLTSKQETSAEKTEDMSRRFFRDSMIIDSKTCAVTVRDFCYERASPTALVFFKEQQHESSYNYTSQFSMSSHTNMCSHEIYDPVFILRFSIHALAKGYIEPLEFARLGLLGLAFVGISSPDDDIRKMGYEVLGCFQKALLNHQSNKGTLQLQLLLTYLQNGITVPWQKIPSLCAVFAAEASFILLDTSQDHFQSLSKFLMRSPNMDLKDIPMFNSFFESGSIHFKKECLWILKLINVGLNQDDDAQILIRKSVMEQLLSFYVSSLSDLETKFLIIQIIKKAVKLHRLARHLVENCGLFSWFSSVILFYGGMLSGDQNNLSMRHLEMVLKALLDLVSLRDIIEWLQKEGLEELAKICSHLHKLLIGFLPLLKNKYTIVDSILHLIELTSKISLNREAWQPHFTISLNGLYQLQYAIDKQFSDTTLNLTAECALIGLLMSSPPSVISQTERATLAKLVLCAARAALRSHFSQNSVQELNVCLLNSSDDKTDKESLLAKLLRWISASIILGWSSRKCFHTYAYSSGKKMVNLLFLLENIGAMQDQSIECSEKQSNASEALAFTILYFQQLSGMKSTALPSVAAALSLLLLTEPHHSPVGEMFSGDDRHYVESLCSKICCPSEVDPAWRWSFEQPREDTEQTSMQRVEEETASQTLLLLFSNSLSGRLSDYSFLSHQDLDRCGLFSWENNITACHE